MSGMQISVLKALFPPALEHSQNPGLCCWSLRFFSGATVEYQTIQSPGAVALWAPSLDTRAISAVLPRGSSFCIQSPLFVERWLIPKVL